MPDGDEEGFSSTGQGLRCRDRNDTSPGSVLPLPRTVISLFKCLFAQLIGAVTAGGCFLMLLLIDINAKRRCIDGGSIEWPQQ